MNKKELKEAFRSFWMDGNKYDANKMRDVENETNGLFEDFYNNHYKKLKKMALVRFLPLMGIRIQN